MHMESTKTVGILILGLVVGAIVGAVGMVLVLRSDVGAGLVAQYVATQPKWPDVSVSQSASTTLAVQQFISGQANIPVPKSYATQAYTAALNATLRDTGLIAASSTELAQLLSTINQRSLEHQYSGFFDLIIQAKGQVATQRARVSQLGQDLTALSAANQDTTDATTKSQTADLITRGQSLQTGLSSYTDALEELLSGSVPSAAQVQALKDEATRLEALATDFSNATKALEQHLLGAQQQ